MAIQKITPFLWFDQQAEEAANFYTAIFPNSKVVRVTRYGEAGPGPAGSAMTACIRPPAKSTRWAPTASTARSAAL